MWTSVGAEGGVTSFVAAVVSVTPLLVELLPLASLALTVNVYVVAGVRCRRTTLVSPYGLTCWVTWTPLAKIRHWTNSDRSSFVRFHVNETCDGPRTAPVSVGAGGGVVSCGVVTVTVLLLPDVLSDLSVAVTEKVYVRSGLSQSIVYVVCPCGTVSPWPSLLTEYVTLPELSVDGSQASETLFWLTVVARKLVGVVGGVRSFGAAAAPAPTTTDARTRASAAPAARRTTASFAFMSFLPLVPAPR